MALKVGELFASFKIDKSDYDAAITEIKKSVNGASQSMTNTGKKLSLGLTVPIIAAGKSIIEAGSDFSSQMSRVEAISGATSDQMRMLEDSAIKMGSTTIFTATESGKAMEYMAMAGWKSQEMLDGIAPIINLAAASGEELGTVSDIVTDSLTAFGLTAKDASKFSDVLAAAAANSNTNVAKMGYSFKYAAPLAGALGYSAEDVAIQLGLMANNGIKAEQAGTSMRSILTRLAKPTKEVDEAVQALGISFVDTKGNVKPLRQIMGELRKSFSGLTSEQKVAYAASIAGRQGMSGLLAILNSAQSDVDALTYSIDNSSGAANKMAKTALNNLKGDTVLLKSALEGMSISLQRLGDGAMRGAVQWITKLVEKFINLDEGTKKTIMTIGAVVAAIGPALMIGGKILSLLTFLASPLGLVTAGVVALGAAFAISAIKANETKLSMEEVKRVVDNFKLPTTLKMSVLDEAKKKADDLAQSLGNVYEKVQHTLVKVELGIELSGDDAKTFADDVEAMLTTGKETIEANKQQVSITLGMMIGNNSTNYNELQSQLFGPFFAQVEAGAKAAGDKARRAMVAAMADGRISASEAAQIKMFSEMYMEEVSRAMMQNEIKAKMLRLKDEGGILPADIKNIIEETRRRTDEAFKTAQESGDNMITLGYRAAIELNYDKATTDKYTQQLRKGLADTLASIKIEGFAAVFNALNDEMVLPDLSQKIQEWGIRLDGDMMEALSNIETRSIYEGLNDSFQTTAAAMYDAMKPDIKKLEEVKKMYQDAGLSIPKELSDVLRRSDVLSYLSQGTAGMFQLMINDFAAQGKNFSEVTQADIQTWFAGIASIINTDVTVQDAMKHMWGQVLDVTFASISSDYKGQLKASLEMMGVQSANLIGITIPQAIVDGINSGKLKVADAAKEIAELMKTSSTDAAAASDTNKTNAETAAGGIKTGIDSKKEEVTIAAGTLETETVAAVQPMVDGMTQAGTDATTNLGTAITEGTVPIVTAADSLATQVKDTVLLKINATEGNTIGKSFMDAIRNAISTAIASVVSTAQSAGNAAYNAVVGALNYSSGNSIGNSFGSGIAAGIRNSIAAISSAASAAASAASSASSSISNGKYVSSPSGGTRSSYNHTNSKTFAADVGNAMANRLIASGAMRGDVVIDGNKAGEILTRPISQSMKRANNRSINGRILQGVLT